MGVDVDLRKVRYFVAVAELLHFRHAAERLHVAQPALSRQVRALESELGVELFRRDTRKVELTPAGTQFLEDATVLIATARAARTRAQRAAREPRVVVGFMPGIVVTLTVEAFAQRHPEVRVDVVRIGWDDQAAMLLDGRIDFGFLRRPFEAAGLRVTLLYTEPYRAALAHSHPLAHRRSLKQADLAGVPLIHHKTHRVQSVEDKLELVAAGKGVSILPDGVARYYKRPDVRYVLVSDAAPNEICVAYRSDRRAGALSELFAIAQEVNASRADRRRGAR